MLDLFYPIPQAKNMVRTLTKPDSKFLVITSLIGTDKPIVLQQTKELQPPVPPMGSPEYDIFVNKFIHSPANVMSTIASFLQVKAEWDITSPNNFQDYFQSFIGAPFVIGVNIGIAYEIKSKYDSVPSLLSAIYENAYVPQSRQNNEYDLEKWLDGDFENTPKTLDIITQNLEATEGNLSLSFARSNFTISYSPPQKSSIIQQSRLTYNLSGRVAISTVTIKGKLYFLQNGAEYLSLGFVNVTDWIKQASTPPIQPQS